MPTEELQLAASRVISSKTGLISLREVNRFLRVLGVTCRSDSKTPFAEGIYQLSKKLDFSHAKPTSKRILKVSALEVSDDIQASWDELVALNVIATANGDKMAVDGEEEEEKNGGSPARLGPVQALAAAPAAAPAKLQPVYPRRAEDARLSKSSVCKLHPKTVLAGKRPRDKLKFTGNKASLRKLSKHVNAYVTRVKQTRDLAAKNMATMCFAP